MLCATFEENLGTPGWRQVLHSTFFSFACELTGRITRVGVLTGIDPHALCTPSLSCTFCTLLGADSTSLDVLRKQLGILSSPVSPQPLPLQPLSLSLSLPHVNLGGGDNAHTLGIHLLPVGAGRPSPESLLSPEPEPSHRTHPLEQISK